MIISALALPLTVLIVPFFGVLGPQLTVYATMQAICAELLFWGGVTLAGRDTWRLVRSHGWRGTPARMLGVMRTGELSLAS